MPVRAPNARSKLTAPRARLRPPAHSRRQGGDPSGRAPLRLQAGASRPHRGPAPSVASARGAAAPGATFLNRATSQGGERRAPQSAAGRAAALAPEPAPASSSPVAYSPTSASSGAGRRTQSRSASSSVRSSNARGSTTAASSPCAPKEAFAPFFLGRQHKTAEKRCLKDGSDGTRTRDLRRDRPVLAVAG